MANIDQTAVEKRMNSGLRNYWYPLVESWMVKKAPIGITRLGEKIAIWRDDEGKVHAINDRCPHRGARMSQGWNIGKRLSCWYHGVEVDNEGIMASVPAVHNCALEGRKLNKSYPIEERAGTIFAWFGDDGVEIKPLELPEQLNSDEWGYALCTAHWNCNYRYAIENVMDPMHGAYLHAVSHSMANGEKEAEFGARNTETGYIFEKKGQTGVNFDWVELGSSGAIWLRLSIPYGQFAGPGGSFFIVGMVVPVTEHSCRVFFWRCRQVKGWQKDSWKFLYRAKLEGLHWDVLEQDRLVLEAMADDARDHEGLYAHDAGLVRYRRLLKQLATEEIKLSQQKELAGAAE